MIISIFYFLNIILCICFVIRPVSGPEVDHLQSEIEALREELERTQREKNKKDTLIRSLKDVSSIMIGCQDIL